MSAENLDELKSQLFEELVKTNILVTSIWCYPPNKDSYYFIKIRVKPLPYGVKQVTKDREKNILEDLDKVCQFIQYCVQKDTEFGFNFKDVRKRWMTKKI